MGLGFDITTDIEKSDFAIAPLLSEKVNPYLSTGGLLVFHPSLLPLYRGKDAIKWQFHNGEKTGGVTWFWANEKLDAGAICAQSAFAIPGGITPRGYYESLCIPEGLRSLETALREAKRGFFRRAPQNHILATRQGAFVK